MLFGAEDIRKEWVAEEVLYCYWENAGSLKLGLPRDVRDEPSDHSWALCVSVISLYMDIPWACLRVMCVCTLFIRKKKEVTVIKTK